MTGMDAVPDPSIAAAAPKPGAPVVLQVLPELWGGGVERGTVDVTAALSAAGWRAVVASGGGPMVREILRAGGTHITLPLDTRNPLAFRRNAGILVEVMRDAGVDLIHARSRGPAWSALAAAQRVGVPLVTTFHGVYSHGGRIKRRYNSVMTRGDRVIAISDFVAGHIRDVYGVTEPRVVTIPRGVDLKVFDPAAVNAARIAQISQAWRLPDGVPVVMLPGRLTSWKGHPFLIEALYRLGRSDYVCVLVGNDEQHPGYRRDLERMVRERELDSIVRFVGHSADMPAAYMLADVVVSASTRPEAFGRVAAEAQAMGRPVIATDHGGARETVLPGETGWLVAPSDANALADGIRRALDVTGAEREALALRARAHIARNFGLEAMGRATLAVYRALLDGAG